VLTTRTPELEASLRARVLVGRV